MVSSRILKILAILRNFNDFIEGLSHKCFEFRILFLPFLKLLSINNHVFITKIFKVITIYIHPFFYVFIWFWGFSVNHHFPINQKTSVTKSDSHIKSAGFWLAQLTRYLEKVVWGSKKCPHPNVIGLKCIRWIENIIWLK